MSKFFHRPMTLVSKGTEVITRGRTSLVVQRLRNLLPIQKTQVQFLVGKIPHAAKQLSL